MTDIFTNKKRSQIMASVKNKNTKPEILVRKALFKKGFRYRINDRRLPGSPDIVLPKYRTVIFVNGCYWHGHDNCKKQIQPNTNKNFWNSKIQKNKLRDKKVQKELSQLGWKTLVIWDCELRNKEIFNLTIERIINGIKSDN
ncbi:MAG: DNA mismatch endonuclease Vsr [Candidatus Lokiarchaeota archaeon]|nr:DNA mismatch endonuclease Vsr [Candidatus Lokiarchaeota archaeon]